MTNPLQNKRIILGVTGSIAAYKAADLASKLTQNGALVDVILTEYAVRFIAPLTFQSVTGRKAYTESDLWGGEGHVTHVGLGHNADLVLIAPVSANTLMRLANGSGDNLLCLTALASHCPLVLAPAMDVGMYSHPATQKNVEILKERGAWFIGPASGHLASGLVGPGRFVEPLEIMNTVRWILAKNGPLAGRKIVVTAGGTQEAIDPVRLITNRSSGTQGYAVAQSAIDAGADVTLITAPTSLQTPIGCTVIQVKNAAEMFAAVKSETKSADGLIMAAAVSDFRPASISSQKIKKSDTHLQLDLEPTADILLETAKERAISGFPKFVVGFAAESQDLLTNAKSKLERKKLDLIVANDINAPDSGFEVNTNRVTFLYPDGSHQDMPLMEKTQVADKIIDQIIQWMGNPE
ncbi:MAG: bifunctional phosphopantothenoylcysteine decarboxylase/phosphopantothenate--cysteine ligase CoaBC [Chloroflexi bacterium]|nr:bifunctional phosphopantothenoylcysteine decarboxylase/phosphopantothenate--cysteine ligase CoaBC [Chloroflexota bacterium]